MLQACSLTRLRRRPRDNRPECSYMFAQQSPEIFLNIIRYSQLHIRKALVLEALKPPNELVCAFIELEIIKYFCGLASVIRK